MPRGYGVDFGWCGFGTHAGPPRVYCLGLVMIAVFPDGIEAIFNSYRIALLIKRGDDK